MRTPKTVLRGVFVCFILLGAVLISNGDTLGLHPSRVGASDSEYNNSYLLTTQAPTPTPEFAVHLPLAMKLGDIEFNEAWIKNAGGKVQYGFQPGDELRYVAEMANYSGYDVSVKLTWTQDGPCGGETLVMDKKLKLKTGVRRVGVNDVAPDCYGVYTNTIEMSYGTQSESFEFRSVVINPSSVILKEGQGFDNCTVPTVTQMATWWEHSPYSTVNLYIGGISAVCPMNRDSGWLYQVAEQGWSFILTWAGPQAPIGCPEDCKYRYPISEDPDIAYQEGKAEADAAVEAAIRRGFNGDLVIYYDIESYSGADANTRNAVASLLQGWTEGLHELGYKSGAYGASCTSYISDWAENDDPPDDVWIAHWNLVFEYDEEADVMDAPCLSNDLWPKADHRRLKQYTGGHKETHGGLTMSIDSNVLDGQVSAILDVPAAQESHLPSGSDSTIEIINTAEATIRDFQLLSPTDGWLQYGDRLYLTPDGGSSWREITPASIGSNQILGAVFLNTQQGWSVIRSYPGLSDGSPSVLRTMDGGNSWEAFPFPGFTQDEIIEVESAFLDFVDSNTGWISLKMQSGSNFSLGRLFATQDGGRTWEERVLPLGEAVQFLDTDRGWVAGGPVGDQLFRTVDGGRTWQSQTLPQTDVGQREIGLPVFKDQVSGVLRLIERNESGSRLFLFATSDAGESWSLSETIQLSQDDAKSTSELVVRGESLSGDLPQGVVALDVFDNQRGWALVQSGSCTGYKPPAGEIAPQGSSPLQCESFSDLLMTNDGGKSWLLISLPH